MGAMSFVMVILHFLCFSTIGILVTFQYDHAIEKDLKVVNKNSHYIYFFSIFLALFIVWTLAATGEFEKQSWKEDLLPIISIIMGFYLTTKVYLES